MSIKYEKEKYLSVPTYQLISEEIYGIKKNTIHLFKQLKH
jgi:hypothetical protein